MRKINRVRHRVLPIVMLALLSVVLSSCSLVGPQSTFSTAGPVAAKQMWLFNYTLWMSLVVIAGVGGFLAYSVVRFRRKSGEDVMPEQTHGNVVIEVGLILLSTVIVIAVAIPTVAINFETGSYVEPTEEDIIVDVVGYQWWWAFEYPEEGIVTANELHIPVGKRVILNLDSADVLHSFWVPKLAGKRDLIPNQDNQLWFIADEPGLYYGQCAELCLGAHAYMRFRVKVDTEEEYAAWLASFNDTEAVQVQADPLITKGQQLFKEKGCAACHAIQGYAVGQESKPNLTNFGLRYSLAAGVLDNTPENLAKWLRDPQAVKPGNYMPTLWAEDDPNREEEIEALVAYLLSLGNEQEQTAQVSVGGANGNW